MNSEMCPAYYLLPAVPNKLSHYTCRNYLWIFPLSSITNQSPIQLLPVPTIEFPWTPVQENKDNCDIIVTTEKWGDQ